MRCSCGKCNIDQRYRDWEHMQGITFILFPQPHKDKKCRLWVNACGRENNAIKDVKKWTYTRSKYSTYASKRFVGGAGPTKEHFDPVPAAQLLPSRPITNGKHIS